MDQKTADFRLSAQDDIAKQLGDVDYKLLKVLKKVGSLMIYLKILKIQK